MSTITALNSAASILAVMAVMSAIEKDFRCAFVSAVICAVCLYAQL